MHNARWLVGFVVTSLALEGCGFIFGEDDDDPDVTAPDAAPNDVTAGTTTVSATGLASLLGIVDYAVSPAPSSGVDLAVALRGAAGAPLGVVDVVAGVAGLEATLATPAGTFVYRVHVQLDDDRLVTLRAFGRPDLALRLTTLATVDAAGEIVETSVELAAPGDPWAVPLGELSQSPNASLVALALSGAGGERELGVVASWLAQVVPASLARAPELHRVIAALEDPALVGALEATAEGAFAPPPTRGALHLSPECRTLRARVHTDPIAPCRKCAELDPNLTSAVPQGLDLPKVLLLPYLEPCRKCALANNARMADMQRCVKAWRQPDEITTDERCAEENPTAFGVRAVATADGHGCENRCEAASCAEFCQTVYARPFGLEVAPTCTTTGACDCRVDLDAFCRNKFAGRICGPSTFGQGCDAAVCGNGRLELVCSASPAAAEVCDASVPTHPRGGCAEGSGCASDCASCTPCECGPDRGCDVGLVCDGCRCREAECNNLLDLVNAQGRWCDAREAERWCGTGVACDAATCRCSAVQCGDGVVGDGEACDTASTLPNRGCPDDQTCTPTCACSGTCGNGTVEPHEQCDPNAATTCPAGRTCSGCACVEACGNGVIDEGEACDKAAANTCGGGQVCTESCQCQAGCGNRRNDPGEACDRSVSSGHPHYGCDPSLACLDDCTCGSAVCGNERVEADEECDTSGFTCPTSDYAACNSACECARFAACGDGVLQPGEECDYKVGPGPCGGEGALAGYLARCKERECRCECPAYAMTACVLADRTIQCPEGMHCNPAADGCSQDTCPSGAVFLEGSVGVCECQGGSGVTTIYDPCRPRYVLECATSP